MSASINAPVTCLLQVGCPPVAVAAVTERFKKSPSFRQVRTWLEKAIITEKNRGYIVRTSIPYSTG